MRKAFGHLVAHDRDMIAVLKAGGKSRGERARLVGKHKSTVSRELRRNAPPQYKGYYLGHKAHLRAKIRWQQSHQKSRLSHQAVRDYVEENLKRGWSPELIAGRIKIDKPSRMVSRVNTFFS